MLTNQVNEGNGRPNESAAPDYTRTRDGQRLHWSHGEPVLELSLTNQHVYRAAEGWYFWDETGMSCLGPYPSEAECNEGMTKYAATL